MDKLGFEDFLLEIFFEVPFVFHKGVCFEKTRNHLCRLRCIGVVRSPSLKMRGYVGGGVQEFLQKAR